jgi:hypothetical protein
MEIQLPFKEQFREDMLAGKKTKTSRTKKYGSIGDTFKAFEATFIIVDQCEEELQFVAEHYYMDEGFNKPKEFIDIWKEIHPRKGWDPKQKVWVHEFMRTDKSSQQRKLEL